MVGVITSMFTPVLLGLSGIAGSRVEREGEECSSFTVTPHKLCFVWRDVSCIHRKRSYWKQIFSDSWFEPKPGWNHSQLLQPAHWRGGRVGAALKLISLILQGVGYFLHYFFFFYEHIFSLSLSLFHSPHQTAALSSSCGAHVSLLSAIWFFKCQHTGACLGGGVTSASAVQWGSTQSPGQMEQPGPKRKYSMRHTITARF